MKRFREVLEILALAAFIGFILLLAYFTVHGARKVKALGDEASYTLEELNRVLVVAGGAASNVEKGARAWRDNSDAQAKQSTLALANVNAAAKSLDFLISSTNSSLNVSLLPNLSRAIDDQNAALLKAEDRIAATATLATATLADADRVIASPRIAESLDNVADSSKSLAVATAAGAATIVKVQSGVTYEVDQIEKPVKKVKVVFLFILTALGHFFGFA